MSLSHISQVPAPVPPDRDISPADRMALAEQLAEIDRAELEAIRALQVANRNNAYRRMLPARYAAASYDTLRPDQDPDHMVSGWRERGPRALLLAGPSRTGKTTAAYAIANDAHADSQWVVVRSAADLSAALKPDGEPLAYQYAVSCDLLIIDDLGRERVTDWWLEQLQRIVDDRCSNSRRLIVTTNIRVEDDGDPDASTAYEALVARYGDPIVERIIDDGGVLIFDGAPVREFRTHW